MSMSKTIMEHVPFLLSAIPPGGHMKPNYTRLFEAVIIAVFTAVATGYVADQVMKERMTHMDKRITVLEHNVDILHPRERYRRSEVPRHEN